MRGVKRIDERGDHLSIGSNVRRVRKERGLGQVELAKRAAMHQPTISEIETGLHIPLLQTLTRIADALDVDVAHLLAEPSDSMSPPPKTPLTDEDAKVFDIRFASTDEPGAVALRKELEPEFDALQEHTKALKKAGVGDEEFALRRARTKLRRAQERLYALNFRENDLAFEERDPKDTVAAYMPSSKETEDLVRSILGQQPKAG